MLSLVLWLSLSPLTHHFGRNYCRFHGDRGAEPSRLRGDSPQHDQLFSQAARSFSQIGQINRLPQPERLTCPINTVLHRHTSLPTITSSANQQPSQNTDSSGQKNSVVCLHTICQSGQSNTPITKQVSLTNYWLLPFFPINKGILKTDHKEMQCTQNLIESQKIIQNENNCNKRESCITLLVQCPDTPVL